MQTNQEEKDPLKAGFALVLALSLMSFVLVLLLSLTLLVRVESVSSNTALTQLRAKESARLALMMALGDLQRYAGPDQRVTARKEINELDNPFWTGVWDTSNMAATPRWLVSWQNQTLPAPVETMQLLGPGSVGSNTADFVSAPSIEVLGTNSSANAKIAWWISDEGVKSSVGSVPLKLRPAPNFLEPESTDAMELLVASNQGLEAIFSNYDRFTSSDAPVLDRISSTRQLLSRSDFLIADADFSGEAPYHSLTPFSFGVLSNSLSGSDGGLMRDLSLFPQLLGAGVEEFLQLGEAHAGAQNQLGNTVEGKRLFTQIKGLDAIGPLNDGDIATPIVPVLSNFMMAFTIRSHSPVGSNPNFKLRMQFFCEFWNPYTHTINLVDDVGNPLNLQLEITGLPDVTVTRTDATTPTSSNPISIQDTISDVSNTNNALVIELVNDQTEPWLPGRAKHWTGLDSSRATGRSPYYSINTTDKRWQDAENSLGGSVGIDTSEPRFPGELTHSSSGNNILRIRVYLLNSVDNSKVLISDIDGIVYEPVTTAPSGYSNTHSGMKFGYHVVLREPHFSANHPDYPRGLWLSNFDPRNPKPDFNADWNLDYDPSIPSGSPYIPVIDGISTLLTPEPQAIYNNGGSGVTINFPIFRRLLDRSSSNGSSTSSSHFNKLWQDAPLFELPRDRILSLASLQHLYFHHERPFQVGNSWGREGATNTSEWFDRYYFSGMSRSDNITDFTAGAGPTNPNLVFYQANDFTTSLADWQNGSASDADSAKSPAEVLLVANRFNINSTSVAAWKAVLSSLRLNNFEYLDYPEDDTSDLSSLSVNQQSRVGTFARFSHSLEETYEAPATPAFEDTEPVAPSAFYRHGARRFDNGEFETFAQEIVRLIKERGTPFTTMESFLSAASGEDSSLIEKAIATVFAPTGRQQWDHLWETTGVRGASSDIIDVDHFSPGFLTQADVLTAIGPMLAPRSDTFTIRARGESLSPDGLQQATSIIEATFQRTPDTVDPTTNPSNSSNRRFKLISLRWLSNEEV